MAQKTELEAVDRLWGRDLARRELHLRNVGRVARMRMRLLGQKTKVEHLHRWFHIWLASEEGIAYENGTVRDSIHVDSVPRKYQLVGGWTVIEEDLPYLSHGPLVAADGKTVLVRPYSLAERVVSVSRVIAALLGVVFALLKGLPALLP